MVFGLPVNNAGNFFVDLEFIRRYMKFYVEPYFYSKKKIENNDSYDDLEIFGLEIRDHKK